MRRLAKVFLLAALAGLVVLIVGVWGWQWLTRGRFEETTDNAYVRADITSVAPKVAGYVVGVYVADNEAVEAGDILFRIDDKDYQARLAQAQANIASTRAALLNVEAGTRLQKAVIAQSEAQLEAALAAQTLAAQDFKRYRSLVRTHAVSEAQFEQREAVRAQADAAVVAAQAALQAQRRKLEVLAAQREAAQATLLQAEAARTLARIDFDNTIVRGPIDGVIGNRQVRVGRFVTTGTSVLDIVPLRHVWIVANFKEVQLENVRVGQSVRVTVDAYPHAQIRGVVDSLSPGSGAAFSLLPADNATGNFVRVVQRVPVKIRLTDVPSQVHLVPGLSARVAIRTAPAQEQS
jgi:membrane fusion protein (multidrug efflux system)